MGGRVWQMLTLAYKGWKGGLDTPIFAYIVGEQPLSSLDYVFLLIFLIIFFVLCVYLPLLGSAWHNRQQTDTRTSLLIDTLVTVKFTLSEKKHSFLTRWPYKNSKKSYQTISWNHANNTMNSFWKTYNLGGISHTLPFWYFITFQYGIINKTLKWLCIKKNINRVIVENE